MKKLYLKLAIFLPIIIAVVFMNYAADPAHLFENGKIEAQIAKTLVDGKNVVSAGNYDSQSVQQKYILSLSSPKEIILLGSSRCLAVNHKHLGNEDYFNHSINGADVEDFEFVIDNYLQKNMAPKNAIICVDPWIFNRNRFDGKRADLQKKSMLSPVAKKYSQFAQLLSPSYFQESLRLAYKRLVVKKDFQPYTEESNDTNPVIVKYWDGSANLKKLYGDKTPEQITELAKAYDPEPLLGEFNTLDLERQKALTNLIDKMRRNNIKVILLLAPYHPLTHQFLMSSPKYSIISKVQEYISVYSQLNNITVMGSYNPDDFSLTKEDFLDGTHPSGSAFRKIIETASTQL